MAITKAEEVFLLLLSHARHGAERSANVYQEISQLAKDPEIEKTLEARAFVSKQTVATLDECFRLIGQQPVKLSGRLEEVPFPTTPSAPLRWLRIFFLMAQPPLLYPEGNCRPESCLAPTMRIFKFANDVNH